jgi:Protein of unknown function (DUF3102)
MANTMKETTELTTIKPITSDIQKHHLLAQAAAKTAVEHALKAGKLLVQAKAAAKHGEWLSFLIEVGINVRTAQRYMKLANNEHKLKYDTVSHLTITEALQDIDLKPEIGQHLFYEDEDKGIYFWLWPFDGEYFHYLEFNSLGDEKAAAYTVFTKKPMQWSSIKKRIPKNSNVELVNSIPYLAFELRGVDTYDVRTGSIESYRKSFYGDVA